MLLEVDEIIANEQLTLVYRLSKELGMPVKKIWKFFYAKGKKQGFLTFTLGNETKYFLKFSFKKYELEWKFDESDLDLDLLWNNCFALNGNDIRKVLEDKFRFNSKNIIEIETDGAFRLRCHLNDNPDTLVFNAMYTGRKWHIELLENA